jgi:hypothetical protein
MADASQLMEIARELRRLQQSSPTSLENLDSWYASARRFTNWQHSTFPDVHLPSQVMFYLHDADIRVRDPEYRKDQDEALDGIILSLERGIVPMSSSGGSLSFHPRWLGVTALVILAVVLWVAR